MQKQRLLLTRIVNYIKKCTMGRVTNLWNGYALTNIEQKILTKMTLNEFKKPVHKRRTPQELMSRVLRLFSKKVEARLKYAKVKYEKTSKKQ